MWLYYLCSVGAIDFVRAQSLNIFIAELRGLACTTQVRGQAASGSDPRRRSRHRANDPTLQET